MSPEQWTAIGGVIVALTGLVTAFTVMWRAIRNQSVKLDANTDTTDATHALVNSHYDEQKVFLASLIGALKNAGIVVPLDPGIASARERIAKKEEAESNG